MLASICGSCLQHLFLWCLPNGDFVFPSFTNWTYSVHRVIPSPLLICQYLFSYVYIMDFKKEFYDLCLAAVHSVMFDSFMTPMDCSTPGFPVLHSLPEFAQIHVHWVSDAIQSSHHSHPLLLLPSIFPSQHQGLFQWVSSSHQVFEVLELQLQH